MKNLLSPMKRLVLLTMVFCTTAFAADPIQLESLTLSGRTYSKAKITRKDSIGILDGRQVARPSEVVISHSDGVSKIQIDQLPAELQKRLGYDASTAKTAASREAEIIKDSISETTAITKVGSTVTFTMRVRQTGVTVDGGLVLINMRGFIDGFSMVNMTTAAPSPEPESRFVIILSREAIQALQFKTAQALSSALLGKQITINALIIEHKSDGLFLSEGAKLSDASKVLLVK